MEDKKMKTLKSSLRKKINNDIYNATASKYHDEIPLDDLFKILGDYGIKVLAEDGTEWEGFLCGEDSEACMDLGCEYDCKIVNGLKTFEPFANSLLRLTWHKMPSGRWEIVAYVS